MKPTHFSPGAAAHSPDGVTEKARVLVIGTGFSGLCMGIQLRQQHEDNFLMLERAADVGGTWRDNTYPGCACDVPSHLYSFSFEANPDWTRKYAPQPEIFAYLRQCAQKYDLLRHVRFNANIVGARFDEARGVWRVQAQDGRTFEGEVLVSGMGGLSNPLVPDLPGLDTFEGPVFHSATWNHRYRFEGQHVAVIGSGASAIQFVPEIAPKVDQLYYFQRTPPWVVPKDDRPLTEQERQQFRQSPWRQRWERIKLYWTFEARFLAFKHKPEWMQLVAKVAKHKIAKAVRDPAVRARLTPDYTPGCKRLLISNDYYPALGRTNVEVVSDGIRAITPRGVVTHDGQERAVDAIVFGTGFKVQDPIAPGTIFGRGGLDLAEAWKHGPEAYKGITIAGFPNFFMLMGPNTGLGHNSMVFMIESQVRYVTEALRTMKENALPVLEVQPVAQRRFTDRVQGALKATVWSSGCKSWYLNAQGRNTSLWPGFTFAYRWQTRSFDLKHYQQHRASAPTPKATA